MKRSIELKFKKDNNNNTICYCNITDALDKLSSMLNKDFNLSHCIIFDKQDIEDKCLFIFLTDFKLSGGPIGTIYLNDNNIITNIHIDTFYAIRYSNRKVLLEKINNFIGIKIDNLSKELLIKEERND